MTRHHSGQSKVKDMTNLKFGKLTVLQMMGNNKHGRKMWLCICECGKTKEIEGASLRTGNSNSCGCGKYPAKDITDLKPYNLKAIKVVGKKDGLNLWECICDCGKSKVVSVSALISGSTKSCGCIHRFELGVASQNRQYEHYRDSAKNRNFKFDLTREEFLQIASKNCHYCGEPPRLLPKRRIERASHFANGVDRVNSTLGYSVDNCVPCCKRCNFMKGDLSVDGFISHLHRVLAYLASTSNQSEISSV